MDGERELLCLRDRHRAAEKCRKIILFLFFLLVLGAREFPGVFPDG
jgi:hypothetical protein